MATKRDVSKEQNERHKRVLKVLLKKEENKFCADCHARGPTWASTNLGVFVCLTCSGVHRSLGVHISVVRSTNLDTWLPDQVAFIQRMDNVKANGYWEASLPSDFRRPRDSEQHKLERFIQVRATPGRLQCLLLSLSRPSVTSAHAEGASKPLLCGV